jgi:cytochrome d ubiquinol oxidase subunit I
LLATACAGPLGMIALEAGWIVTEVGRQPWIIQGYMRTSEAVTRVQGIWMSLVVYTALYSMLGAIVVSLLLMQFRDSPAAESPETTPTRGDSAP